MQSGTVFAVSVFVVISVLSGCARHHPLTMSAPGCSDFAGFYKGIRFSEKSCNGTTYFGTLSGSVTNDCRFDFESDNGVTIKGMITSKLEKGYAGRGESSYCGPISLVCESITPVIRCRYKYDTGGEGTLFE